MHILESRENECNYKFLRKEINVQAFDLARFIWLYEGGPKQIWQDNGKYNQRIQQINVVIIINWLFYLLPLQDLLYCKILENLPAGGSTV